MFEFAVPRKYVGIKEKLKSMLNGSPNEKGRCHLQHFPISSCKLFLPLCLLVGVHCWDSVALRFVFCRCRFLRPLRRQYHLFLRNLRR